MHFKLRQSDAVVPICSSGNIVARDRLSAIILPLVMPALIRARLLPSLETANRLSAWRWHLSFDVLAALGMAVGAGTLGLMAPSRWPSYRRGPAFALPATGGTANGSRPAPA